MINLTVPQHQLVVKIASHFKLSSTAVRKDIDETKLQAGILAFPGMNDSELNFEAEFYCSQGKFNLGQILDPNKFFKSDFYQNLLNAKNSMDSDSYWAYYSGGGGLWIITRFAFGYPNLAQGDALICISHPKMDDNYITIEPVKNFLASCYPRPEEE